MLKYLLFESAVGYALFEKCSLEEIGQSLDEFQKSILDFTILSRIAKLISFDPFKTTADALKEISFVSEGLVSPQLSLFLSQSIPKSSKGFSNFQLGVSDRILAGSIKHELSLDCVSDENVNEIIRAIRMHFHKLIDTISLDDVGKAQLGLSHAYSRSKVKFNVNRVDNMIIQAISLVDQIDKDINTFGMRVKEWYSWHFPELSRLVPEITNYAKIVLIIKNRQELSDEKQKLLGEMLNDTDLVNSILELAEKSIGSEISHLDLLNIERFASQVVSLCEYRASLHSYLADKMNIVAPNLSSLIGNTIGARLISHAGSLTNLAKYPASTVQILGAEKALFRALKTKSKTPKYGLIYHSGFIGKSTSKNKGRISRLLANKCAIASRIDCFSDKLDDSFGKNFSKQIEERIKFYESI